MQAMEITEEQKQELSKEFGVSLEAIGKIVLFTQQIANNFFVMGGADILRHVLDRDYDAVPGEEEKAMRAYMEELLLKIRKGLTEIEEKNEQKATTLVHTVGHQGRDPMGG